MKVAHICTRNVISVGIVGVLSLDEIMDAPAVKPSALAEVIGTGCEREAGRFEPGAPPPMLRSRSAERAPCIPEPQQPRRS